MILDDFREILSKIEPGRKVYFGMGPREPKKYNYIVFNRVKTHNKDDNAGFTDYYEVVILDEDFLPEGLDDKVIKALTEGIKGLKLCLTVDTEYMYLKKQNTDINIEFMRIIFYKARKRVSK